MRLIVETRLNTCKEEPIQYKRDQTLNLLLHRVSRSFAIFRQLNLKVKLPLHMKKDTITSKMTSNIIVGVSFWFLYNCLNRTYFRVYILTRVPTFC